MAYIQYIKLAPILSCQAVGHWCVSNTLMRWLEGYETFRMYKKNTRPMLSEGNSSMWRFQNACATDGDYQKVLKFYGL